MIMDEGLQKILDKINSEAESEEKKIISEAEKEAEGILSEAEEKTSKEVSSIEEKYVDKAERTRGMVKASTRISAKMRRLRAENRAIDEAFEKARDELLKFKKTRKYPAFLESEIGDSLGKTGKSEVELVVSKNDKKHFTSSFLKKLEKKTGRKVKLSGKTRDLLGGAIILVPAEGIEINCSFEAKLKDFREKNTFKIAKTLYPSEHKTE